MTIDGTKTDVSLDMWDVTSLESFDRVRQMVYRDADLFFVCFSTVKRSSFQNVRVKWISEVTHQSPDAKLILLGFTSYDLNENEVKEEVSTEQVEAYRVKCGALAYFQIDIYSQDSVNIAFDTGIELSH